MEKRNRKGKKGQRERKGNRKEKERTEEKGKRARRFEGEREATVALCMSTLQLIKWQSAREKAERGIQVQQPFA